QQLVLAVEVLVEAAQRLLRTVDDLLDRELGRAALVDQLEGGIEEALNALLRARPSGAQALRDGPMTPRGRALVIGFIRFGLASIRLHRFAFVRPSGSWILAERE